MSENDDIEFSMASLIKSHRDLIVWQKSVRLAVDLYSVTRSFPSHERLGMTSQIQRSGVSIPANIAEGNAKSGPGNYLNHLSHSSGSLAELDTLLVVSHEIGYLADTAFDGLVLRTDEIGRLLNGLTASIAASDNRGPYRHRRR
jgi:four helix bundle protein